MHFIPIQTVVVAALIFVALAFSGFIYLSVILNAFLKVKIDKLRALAFSEEQEDMRTHFVKWGQEIEVERRERNFYKFSMFSNGREKCGNVYVSRFITAEETAQKKFIYWRKVEYYAMLCLCRVASCYWNAWTIIEGFFCVAFSTWNVGGEMTWHLSDQGFTQHIIKSSRISGKVRWEKKVALKKKTFLERKDRIEWTAISLGECV